ncbi:MAG: tRNA pseudouridine(38-40) synthase TruA [Caldiserica bacterium]|nr:MAG: tRNA pseudouridine(38-40) synthase TruA [Caldisericota bacterium]
MNIKLCIQFKGDKFFGFQKQKNKRTVQGEIEKALKRIFKKEIKTTGCSRTDRGVHAKEFVLNFKIDKLRFDLKSLINAMNYYLPEDVRVYKAEEVRENFNSRYMAKYKIYRYYVYNRKILSPFLKGFVYHFPYKLDFKKMENSLKYFVGEKDFKNFSVKGEKKNTICKVSHIRIRKKGGLFFIEIKADRFLYKMVRKIAGTILMIGRGKIKVENIERIFEGMVKSGDVLPPEGLYLWKVIY